MTYQPITPEHSPTVFLEPDGSPYCLPYRRMRLVDAIALLTKAGRRLEAYRPGRRTWQTGYLI